MVIGTLAINGWAVTFSMYSEEGLGELWHTGRKNANF